MARPSLVVTSVTLASPTPRESAEAGWAQLRTGTLTLNIEYERHWTPIVWPAEEGCQASTQHLDIFVEDLDAAVAWALSCGARASDHQPQENVRVLLDPVGHPFCLFT